MSDRRDGHSGWWAVTLVAAAVAGWLARPGSQPTAAARGPATTQSTPPPPPPPPAVPLPDLSLRHGGRGNHGGRGPGGGPGRVAGPPQAAEQADAMKFMEKYAPESFKAITALPEGSEERTQKEQFLTTAYRSYQTLHNGGDADGLYDVLLKRVRAEDRVFGLTVKYRQATAPADREAITKLLRSALADWADVSLKERQLRLDRLDRAAQNQRKLLAEDEAHKERMIDRRLRRITADGDGSNAGGGEPPPDGGRH